MTSDLQKTKTKKWTEFFIICFVVITPLFQVTSLWFFGGEKVDESEMVHFAVGFLGGDLDPVWDGYGHLGMYLLGIVYFLMGLIPVAIGKFDSFVDYGTQLLTNGHFFIVARVVFAVVATLATLAFARVSYRQGMPIWLSLVFVVFMTSLPTTIFYANYIRTDTLVMFFSVISISVALTANGVRGAIILAGAIAAAVACKISALSLVGLLFLVLFSLIRNKKISWKEAVFVGLLFLLFLQLFEPFMNYPYLLGKIVLGSYSGGEIPIARIKYSGMFDVLLKIIEFHIKAIGMPLFVLSLISTLGFFKRYRKFIGYSWATAVLLVLPYLPGAMVRDYWFIPTYSILTMMGFVSISILLELFNQNVSSRLKPLITLPLIALIVFFPLNSALKNYSGLIAHQKSHTTSNGEMAKTWLENNHLGRTPILLDGHFFQLYPKLYDPGNLIISRKVSRLFIYDRGENEFLGAVLEKNLYSDYIEKNFTMSNPYLGLHRLRVDLHPNTNFLKTPVVCSYYSKNCIEAEFIRSKDIEISKSGTSGYSFKINGDDPYLVFALPSKIATDGSFFTRVSCDGTGGQLFFDFGNGFSQFQSINFMSCQANELKVIDKNNQIWVNRLRAGENPHELVNNAGEILFVTSPAGYGRFRQMRSDSIDQSRVERAMVYNDHYDQLLRNKPIKIFNKGAGPSMEIYLIPGSVRTNQ